MPLWQLPGRSSRIAVFGLWGGKQGGRVCEEPILEESTCGKILAVSIVALACLLIGCGPSEEQKAADAEAAASASASEASASAEAEASASAEAEEEAEASASAEAEALRQAELDAARATQAECRRQMGALLNALEQIDGRLDVGLTNADLSTRLGDVAVAYNNIPFKKIAPECLVGVGVPLENAYNEYNKSVNKWDTCINDFYCSVEGAKLA